MMDEFAEKLQKQRLVHAKKVKRIVDCGDYLDDDGYPTEDALKAIELWDWGTNGGSKGWFDFIASIWHFKDFGWWEGECEHKNGEKYYGYAISTGGWSGNESIIYAMQRNKHSLWHLSWVSSHRGGHYEFELQEIKDE
jgi:hypothetical protein